MPLWMRVAQRYTFVGFFRMLLGTVSAVLFLISVQMQKQLLLAGLFFGATASFAQTNFLPGHVVTLAGDTLRGEVDVRGAQRSAVICRFRKSGATEAVEYAPAQLVSYTVTGGKTYMSYPVKNGLVGVQPAFLEQLVPGPAQLLFRRDAAGIDRYYLKVAADSVRELRQEKRTEYAPNGQKFSRPSNAYQYTLAEALKGCLVLQPRIAKTPFRMHELANLVSAYNNCVDPASTPIPKASLPQYRSKVKVSVLAGAQVSNVKVHDISLKLNRRIGSDVAPVGGVVLHLPTPFINLHTAVQLQVLYSQQRYSGELPYYTDGDAKYTIDERTIRIPLLFRYTAPGRTIQPFVQAGIMLGYALRFDNSYVTPPKFGSSYYSQTRLIIPDHRNSEQGILASLGATTAYPDKRNLSLEIRAERSNGFSDYGISQMPARRYFLLLSYDLTK